MDVFMIRMHLFFLAFMSGFKGLLAEKNSCDVIKDEDKFDCFPEDGASEALCIERGCCWKGNTGDTSLPPLNVPYCFYPLDYSGYFYDSIKETEFGFVALLKKNKSSHYVYQDEIETLEMKVYFYSPTEFRVKVLDHKKKRYEVPYPKIQMKRNYQHNVNTRLYIFQFIQPNSFKVIRKVDGVIVFNTGVGNLIYADQFIQLSTVLPSDNIYGLGESLDSFKHSVQWNRLTFFASDQPPFPHKSLYGSHPVYLVMENSGLSHGIFMLNSNAMEVILQPKPALTFRTIGGIIDLLFFMGPSPGDVISQYISVVGRPMIPPYWSLGFHLCRFGYRSVQDTRKVWMRNRKFQIPFDTQWNDIDYMDKRKDFTIDGVNFGTLSEFVKEIHDAGMKYISITDPAISANQPTGTYPPFDDGVNMDIFIKNDTNNILLGQVWPRGPSAFPDFTNLNSYEYWRKQLSRFISKIHIDGIWIDMNEPSNFVEGSIHGCPNNKYENPVYIPPLDHGRLAGKTLCMTAKQKASIHYNVHNLYGLTETMATNYALRKITKKRPFIISRSSFPSHGKFGGHWSGDIESNWFQMRRSISSILNFNMFGVPMVGADICGFNGNTTVELCQRWMELGAFYPFSRNHNSIENIDQDPAVFGPDVAISSRNALLIRYTLLPYLYTLFYESAKYGKTVARPLFFEFSFDKKTYDIDSQFLWGSAVHIIPVLQKGSVKVKAYLPKGIWYSYFNYTELASSGSYHTLDTPMDKINVFFRGGNVIPTQPPNVTTTLSRLNNYELIVVYDDKGNSFGNLYLDDGEVIDPINSFSYSYVNFNSSKHGWFYSHPITSGYKTNLLISKISFLNMKDKEVNWVKVNDKSERFFINNMTHVMVLKDLKIPVVSKFHITWG